MTGGLPKHVSAVTDRHGRIRYRFRRRGVSAYIASEPGTPAFDAEYARLMGDTEKAPPKPTTPGTVEAVIQELKRSPAFARLSAKTRAGYDRSFALFADKIGSVPIKYVDRRLVYKLQEDFADKPATANAHVRHLSLLMSFAIDRGHIGTNPCARVKRLDVGEWRSWTEDEIATFLDRVPEDALARRIVLFALCTAQRRGDLVRMTVEDVQAGRIRVVQEKTGEALAIPMHPALQAELDARPPIAHHLLHGAKGEALTVERVTKTVARACCEIGLPDALKLHGLRKAACRRLAEAGASAHEIQAVSGHRTLQMVSHYTKAVDKGRLADSAMDKLALSNR